ncbi:MAG TPA: hypothetical protein VIL85_29805 [Thermomicrobiales bacterium]|jgi:hypothetical protein
MIVEQALQISKHAEVLATVCLARRSDLSVIPVSRYNRKAGYDLLVQLNNKKPDINMSFAIAVKGMLGGHHESYDNFVVHYSKSQIKNGGLPICVFLFNVDSEQGYYRWLYEPAMDEDGRPYLRLDRQVEGSDNHSNRFKIRWAFQPLDNDALERIIDQVKNWYRAKQEH